MSVKLYHAPWGRRVWLITATVTLLGIATTAVLPLFVPVKKPEDRWALWLAPAVVGAIIGGTALWMIRRFELTDEAIVVRRPLWANAIPLATVESAEADAGACEGAWKTMGNDGLFAMHGRFRSKRLGKFQAYVTDPANSVVLRQSADTVVISPENPRQFVNELNRRLTRLKEQR